VSPSKSLVLLECVSPVTCCHLARTILLGTAPAGGRALEQLRELGPELALDIVDGLS
jgi:hypothetical protein